MELETKNEENTRPLDATVAAEIVSSLQVWINTGGALGKMLYLDYAGDADGLGFYMRTEDGHILKEDILGGYTAEVIFAVYYKTDVTPDGEGQVYKPLNDLSEWLTEGELTNIDLGVQRTATELMTLKGPTDTSGANETGNTTFHSIYKITFIEEEH